MPSYDGMYRGSVADIDDPAGKGRLRVLVPQVLGEAASAWAEPTLPTTKNQYSINDRVWVTFEGGNVNRPTFQARLLSGTDDLAPGAELGDSEEPTSPVPITQGLPNSIFVRVEGVSKNTSIAYHVSADPTAGLTFVPDGTTLIVNDVRTSLMVTQLPDGAALAPDTEYYFKTVASNNLGTADPSDGVVGKLDLDLVETQVMGTVAAGFGLFGEITVGANIRINSVEGIVITLPDGEIRLPTDGATDARITAHTVAQSLTVEDNANLYQLTRVFGKFELRNGIPNPTVKAGASLAWDHINTEFTDSLIGDSFWGLSPSPFNSAPWVLSAVDFFGGTLREFSTVTGAKDPFIFPDFGSEFTPRGGVTLLGGFIYLLGHDSSRGDDWYVFKYSSDGLFTKLGEFLVNPSTFTYNPTLTNDGTNLVIGRIRSTDNKACWKVWTPSGTLVGSEVVTNIVWPNASGLRGMYIGLGDFGDSNVHVVLAGSNTVRVTNTSGTEQTSFKWDPVGTTRGLMFDGTNFITIDSEAKIWKYTNVTTTQTVNIGYTWWDQVGTTHESMISPLTSFSWVARAKLFVSVPPAPEVAAVGSDLANAHRVYIGVGSPQRLQAGLAIGTTFLVLTSLNTVAATPPGSNGFDSVASTAGQLVSGAKNGSGVAVTVLDGQGFVRLDKYAQKGQLATGTVTAGVNTTQSVTFNTPFDVIPGVRPMIHADPDTFKAFATGVSTTGFTMNARRETGTASFNVHWLAMADTP